MPQETKLRFNEMALSCLKKNFTLIENQLPEDIKLKRVEREGKVTEAKHIEFHTDKFYTVKFAEINAEDRIYIRTCVIAPIDDYDFPVFSYDLSEAKKYLFLISDMHPLRRTPEYMAKYIAPLKSLHEESTKIPFVEGARQSAVEWAKEFESGSGMYLRCPKEYEEKVESLFQGYLDIYIQLVKDAQKISSPSVKDEIIKHKNYYKNTYREKDPGFGPMKALFGEEWAKRSFENFPF